MQDIEYYLNIFERESRAELLVKNIINCRLLFINFNSIKY